MKKRILWTIAAILPCVLALFIACVKDLEDEGIYTETKIIGTVVEKSTMQPIKGVIVSVTDGTHIHASTTTNSQGAFSLKDIDYEACKQDYYLWLDGSQLDLPSKQEVLKGVGREVYDYKALVLYDKTNVDLLPFVYTVEISEVTAISAKVSGTVTSDGDHEVSERGVCVALHQVPTLKDSVFTSGAGLGDYTCPISGLTKSTTYYVRTYAINSIDTVYGAQLTFQTLNGEASVTTATATDIKYNSATMSGEIESDGGADITERGFCWSTSENPTTDDSCTSDGNGLGAFSHTLHNLESSTTYYYRAYATNVCGTTYGTQASFTTTSGLAILTTAEATNITATSAKCKGNITDNGGCNVTARGVCWNTAGNPDISDNHASSGTGNGSFTCSMSNLTPGTTYHVRAYATNSQGTSYGNEVTFTTLSGRVTLTTTDVSNITATSAKCGGNITDNGGFDVTARGICWNTAGNPDISDSHKASGTGNGSFTCNMSNLTPGTTYHVRAYATNSQGTYYGNEKTFTTSNGSVTMTLAAATNITATSASCSVNITDDGGASITERGLCWATTQNPTKTGSHVSSGTGTGSFSATISSLTPATTYYVRAYAVNAAGTKYSSQISFTTADGLPTLTTSAVSDITATTAKCGGEITANGGFNVTARGVCWNTTGNPNTSDSHKASGTGNGSFTCSMSNLTPGATYYVRAYATNSQGTKYGNTVTFTTSNGSVTMTLAAATNITATSASCSVNITNDGGASITERGICWATTQNPTKTGSHVSSGTGTGSFSATMSSLTPATTYYVRAYAVNAAGTKYSSQISFTTEDGLPTLTTSAVSNITATTAKCGGEITANGGFNVTARGVCWNTAGNPDISDSHKASGSGNGSFTCNMSNLTPGTTYHVRAYATNSQGTSYGNEKTFTTSNGSVTMTLAAATNITATSASCSVNITDDGGATITERGICWSTAQYPTIAGSSVAVGSGTGTFTASMNDLSLSTTYYARAYAINTTGTNYSNQISFTTANGLPTVTTGSVSNITASTATCSGNVTSDGGFAVTAKGLCWSTSQYPTVENNHSINGNGIGSFNGAMSNLQTGTTYYVRAYATNSTGTVYGSQTSFTTTTGLPTVVTNEITTGNVTSSSFTCSGSVTNAGDAIVTARGFCWSTTGTPTLSDNHSTDGTGTGAFTHTITGVSVQSQTFYIRAYATNQYGTAYGETVVQSQSNPYHLPTVTIGGTTYMIYPLDLGEYPWQQAKTTANNLTAYGYSDWRLMTEDEGLLFRANTTARSYFTRNVSYWTSTFFDYVVYDYDTNPWTYKYRCVYIKVNGGSSSISWETNSYNVRPIRTIIQ